MGEKTRGYATFTTNIDFSDATVITPSDDWVSAIQNAAPGSKIALAPGTYELSGTNLVISNSVKIGAQNSASLPILNANIHLTNEASLMLYQVILDGTGNSNSAIEFKGAGSYSELTLKGCEIRNFETRVLSTTMLLLLLTISQLTTVSFTTWIQTMDRISSIAVRAVGTA